MDPAQAHIQLQVDYDCDSDIFKSLQGNSRCKATAPGCKDPGNSNMLGYGLLNLSGAGPHSWAGG